MVKLWSGPSHWNVYLNPSCGFNHALLFVCGLLSSCSSRVVLLCLFVVIWHVLLLPVEILSFFETLCGHWFAFLCVDFVPLSDCLSQLVVFVFL